MLQVARLAPKQLQESRELVAAFARGRQNSDGGFQDRAGRSDLYYTVFGLESLIALQETVPVNSIADYLRTFGDGDDLDFVPLACLARCWAGLGDCAPGPVLRRIETFRTPEGGFHATPGAPQASVYGCFLALGAYQDMREEMPHPERLLASLAPLRSRDGGYSNQPDAAVGLTTTTAAAVTLHRALDAAADPQLGMWLLERCVPSGGFFAAPAAPIPDLLSTATALHALAGLHVPLAGIREPCLDFIDSLWTNQGAFYGSWADDTLDCEYLYYALLALGHLSV